MLHYLIEKEFKQIFRNSFLPKIIFIMPIMMLLIMPWVASLEVKNIQLSIIDHNHSNYSRRLIEKINASAYFLFTDYSASNEKALESIEKGSSDIILEIPVDFEQDFIQNGMAKVMISANSVNGVKGGLGSSYLASLLADYADELRAELGIGTTSFTTTPSFGIAPQYQFNPTLDYKIFMVPALMVMLLTMLAGFLPALNIVGEKESGTIEQINVTPVNKWIFILGKLIPYWLIGFVVLTIGIIIAAVVYHLIPTGSLLTIYLFAGIYILVVSGMGLIISNYSNTLQQAMFVMFFCIMVLILMSGLFTPVSSMPKWAQTITLLNPLKYFMQVMRLVYLKGSGFGEMIPQFLTLCGFATILNGWAVLSYKKSA